MCSSNLECHGGVCNTLTDCVNIVECRLSAFRLSAHVRPTAHSAAVDKRSAMYDMWGKQCGHECSTT